jgi:hypothetical protein
MTRGYKMGNKKQFIDDMTVITISIPVDLNKKIKTISGEIGVSKSSLIQTYILMGVRENHIKQKIIIKNEELKIKPTVPVYEVITNSIMDKTLEKYKSKLIKLIEVKGLRIAVDLTYPKVIGAIEEECIKQGSDFDKNKSNIKKTIGIRIGQLSD